MSILQHLAQAAAVILLIELLVVLLVFLGISGGLAFGLRWTRGKTNWAFEKINTYSAIGHKYIHKGTDYLALPVIRVSGAAEQVQGTLRSLQQHVRRIQASRSAPQLVAARPVTPPVEEPQAPDVLV